MSLISIVVPCYNQAQYLAEALQSILDQTFEDWECIIVNDGSMDHTEIVAKEWCAKDARFRYLEQTNAGPCSARNNGIEMAKGEWILPLDADDKIGSDYLSLAVNVIDRKPNVGIVYCKAAFFGDINEYWSLENFNFKKFLFSNQIYCSGFYKKEDWALVGGYDLNMKYGLEDWEFWINLLSITNKEVVKIDYIGFFYRRKLGSRDHELNKDKIRSRKTKNYIFEKHKELYLQNFGAFIDILEDNFSLQEKFKKNEEYSSHINKNIFTRLLYKIIVLLS